MLSIQEQSVNRHQWVSVAAYFLAEAKNFNASSTLDNWLEAEIAYSEMLITAYLAALEEDNEPITTFSLQQLAASIGISHVDKLNSKTKLIQAIQNTLRHRPCFHDEDRNLCHELECQWKSECLRLTAVWTNE